MKEFRIGVTVSEPDHPSVIMRKEKNQKFIKVKTASTSGDAINKAKAFYKKQGYKVHDAVDVTTKNESKQISEALKMHQSKIKPFLDELDASLNSQPFIEVLKEVDDYNDALLEEKYKKLAKDFAAFKKEFLEKF